MRRFGIVSGYFNPLHGGHVDYINAAKKLCDCLIVIVNNDEQVKLKGSVPFMDQNERMKIVENLKSVDRVVLSVDKDRTVCKTLANIRPHFFFNGGDQTKKTIPETAVCNKFGIKMVFSVGGRKTQNSSELIKRAWEHECKRQV